ncbi:MAG: DUF2459 domain-containing protein [Pseudomonas sp.]
MLALALTLFGCATASGPPAGEVTGGGWRTFYVVNHGLHTGLAIARPDLLRVLPALAEASGAGDFVEFGWGDEDFYRAPQATLGLTLGALFWSKAAVLHVVEIAGDPRRRFAGSEVIEVRVTEDGYRQLLAFLAGTFTRSAGGALATLGPGQYGESRFYQAEGSYSLFYTCNTWVAEALAVSGCPVSPRVVVTAGNVMSQLRQATAASASCLAAR